jgi:hypothetical protein
MFLALTASIVLVTTTILVLYETLRLTSEHLSELPVPPRVRILAVVLMTFVGHSMAVWIYAGAYWLLVLRLGIGTFAGVPVETFEDCLYFSVVAYTSLGFGDHFPTSHTRLLAGVEALNGLLLIGWSASFTYLAMERYWPLHGKAHAHRAARAGDGIGTEPGRDRLFPPRPEVRANDNPCVGSRSPIRAGSRLREARTRRRTMRQYLVTFDKVVPDDSGHDHSTKQHQVVVSACSELSAAHAAKALFCEAAGIVDWRQRADSCVVAELAASTA